MILMEKILKTFHFLIARRRLGLLYFKNFPETLFDLLRLQGDIGKKSPVRTAAAIFGNLFRDRQEFLGQRDVKTVKNGPVMKDVMFSPALGVAGNLSFLGTHGEIRDRIKIGFDAGAFQGLPDLPQDQLIGSVQIIEDRIRGLGEDKRKIKAARGLDDGPSPGRAPQHGDPRPSDFLKIEVLFFFADPAQDHKRGLGLPKPQTLSHPPFLRQDKKDLIEKDIVLRVRE